jgi:hypothetical protein
MVLDAVLARFVEHSPITVMAQLALDRSLEPGWIDGLFEEHRQRQYTRELLFSTTVDLMAVVVVGLQPSVHAAAQARKDLPVSLAALYDKINNTEPSLSRALVVGSVRRLEPVLRGTGETQASLCPGYCWAELFRKTFGFEIVCEKCHSQLRLIALIKTEAVAKKILKAMHLPTELGPAHPAPAPRGFAAPVAELHPARPARPPPGDTGGGDDWLN